MGSYFEKNYENIKYSIDSEERLGLRNAQLGAIHAIASFFTINKKDAAIIVMPTGSGKSSVLVMTPFLLRKKRALIVTPSKMVRGQIANDFGTLKTLCKINVFEPEMDKPVVYEMKHKYDSSNDLELIKADVIVATPNCALSLSESEWGRESIDIVLVDEAHHTPAKTWQQILINLMNAVHVLFTATPFRLDRKEVAGEIIYDYPLSKAYEDGVFGEIQFIPVDDGDNNDLRIAKKAEEIVINDRNEGYEHCLMVRTNTKENAKTLEKLYCEHTSLRVSRVDSSMSYSRIEKVLNNLKNNMLDGIICVDMLGEGYDFPNLKIAAIHVPHKSLASTLQFVGRFARTNAKKVGTAKFIAADNDELEIENNKLFSRDAIWQDLIIGMSEKRNTKEQKTREYYKAFSYADENSLSSVPVQAIRPNCHDKIFRVSGFNILSEFPDICNVADRVLRNFDEKTVVGIGLDYYSPLWMGNGEKINQEYSLYIIHYQEKTKMLHIYSQNHSEMMYEELVGAFCDEYEQIPKYEINRVLGELKDFEIFNSGMLSKQAQSGESYRIMAGSDVSDAIDKDSGRMYSAGHAFCKAVNKNNEAITIGYSSASKVWSSAYEELKDYIGWCDEIGVKIANASIKVKTNTNFDYLPLPKPLEKYPSNVFFADFNPSTYSSSPLIKYVYRGREKYGRLVDMKLCVQSCHDDYVEVVLSLDTVSEIIRFGLKGNITILNPSIVVSMGNVEMTLSDYLKDYPLLFKTTDDATITGTEVIEGDYRGEIFDRSIIEGVDWKKYNTDITKEFGECRNSKMISIQDALYILLDKDMENRFILYDHGSGEMADYITIKEMDNEIKVELYHVKKMSAQAYNNSVGDVYEVAGQAMKSIMWFGSKARLIEKLENRNKSGHAIVKKGGRIEEVLRLLRTPGKLLRGCICIVQPGISQSQDISPAVQEVLSATNKYVRNAGKVDCLKILGSL